jgi:hypothetical protein
LKSGAIHTTLAAAALAGLLLTSGCADPQAGTQPTAATPATPVSTATAGPTPSGPAPGEGASPAPNTPQAAATATFTFPDGHVSFVHPADWTVRTKPGPALNNEAQKTSFEAVISDATGTEVAQVFSGIYGDGAAGPATRTILDHAPVPGLTDKTGEATEFGFAYDEHPGSTVPAYYFMEVRHASEFLAPSGTSGTNQVSLPNGVLTARVDFGDKPLTPAFTSPDAAKAWMGSEQYAQLKAMLLSLRYA